MKLKVEGSKDLVLNAAAEELMGSGHAVQALDTEKDVFETDNWHDYDTLVYN